MLASQNGMLQIIQIVLKGGADPDVQEESGWTVLMFASENDHSEVIQILLKERNIEKENGWTTLTSANMNGHSEAVEILLEGCADINIQRATHSWLIYNY